MTAAGKRLVTDHQSGGNDRACLMSVGLLEDRIAEAEEQAATEADLRLLVMTTARDAAVVEADRLREAATEVRRELLAKVEGLVVWTPPAPVKGQLINRAAVLRLIEESDRV